MTKTEVFTKAKGSLYVTHSSEPLDYCTARILYNKDYVALQSYTTIVAVYDRTKNFIIIDGFYSATTSKHIEKFIKKFSYVNIIWGYLRSDRKAVQKNNKMVERYNKKTYADAFISDFESIISKYI